MLEGDALTIAILIFPDFDQLDATGPFEVLAQLRGSRVLWVARDAAPVRDMRGLTLVPNATFSDVSAADVLVVPGGAGQELLMEDELALDWIRLVFAGAKLVLSVCTGALILGAAGLLRGRRMTTHWAAHELLPLLGAEPIRERVVVDGTLISTAGVSAGIDGALRAVAELRGESTARAIQLGIEYDPSPPFSGGTPETTPVAVLGRVEQALQPLRERRRATVQRVRARLAID